MMNKQVEAIIDALEATQVALEAIQVSVAQIAVNTTPAESPDAPEEPTT